MSRDDVSAHSKMVFFGRRESARMCFAHLKGLARVYGSRHVAGVDYPLPVPEPEPPVERAVISPDGKMDWR